MAARLFPLGVLVLALSFAPIAGATGNYVGVLRPSAKPAAIAIPEPGFYWPLAGPFGGGFALETPSDGVKLKLGYRYSRYFAVETGYAAPAPLTLHSPFAGTGSRGTGFSMETVGTLPLWKHAALYGKFGAWRSTGGASLVGVGDGIQRPGAGLRYGLGLKYDLTRRVGVQAEMERFSALDRWGPRESDTDQVTLGLTWRF